LGVIRHEVFYDCTVNEKFERAFKAIVFAAGKIGTVIRSDEADGTVYFSTPRTFSSFEFQFIGSVLSDDSEADYLTIKLYGETYGSAATYKKVADAKFAEFKQNIESYLDKRNDFVDSFGEDDGDEIAQFNPSSSEKTPLPEKFTPNKSVGLYLQLNTNQHKWRLPFTLNRRIYDYNELVSYELIEDGETITSGGLGRSIVGLTFGAVGGIIGGVTAKRRTKSLCSSLLIRITVNDIHESTRFIKFIETATKKSSLTYKSAFKNAQECLSIFELINKYNEEQEAKLKSVKTQVASVIPPSPAPSIADELLKYKSLLDSGVITQEEFEKFKISLIKG